MIGIGAQMLDHIKSYLIEKRCELLFAWPSDNSVNWYNRNNFSSDNDIVQCLLTEE